MIIRRFDKAIYPPSGLEGGNDGAGGKFVINLGTPEQKETRASARYEMKAGDRFLIQSAGGGGYGSPRERDAEAVKRDVAEGYVSKEAAASIYGKTI
jgi:N-methylhydantoinase B